eukprot:486734-Pyramimonas_sp.AAC.1
MGFGALGDRTGLRVGVHFFRRSPSGIRPLCSLEVLRVVALVMLRTASVFCIRPAPGGTRPPCLMGSCCCSFRGVHRIHRAV